MSCSCGLHSDLSQERGPASPAAVVSNFATTAHECRILAFTKFKEASFQLKPSEIPFQPLEWPGEPQPRGLRQYNDAWHNSATVLQAVPRKPHNMCHCVPCFAAQPRCSTLACTGRPGGTVNSQRRGRWDRFRGQREEDRGFSKLTLYLVFWYHFCRKSNFSQRAGCENGSSLRRKGQLSACQEWLYRKPCALLLCWILLNTRGNQEKKWQAEKWGHKDG